MKSFLDQEAWTHDNLNGGLKEFLDDDVNSPFLAHYCSSISATSIIQSKICYFSPIDVMNDHSEFNFLYEKIVKHLLIIIRKRTIRNVGYIIDVIDSIIDGKDNSINNAFVFCLTKLYSHFKADNLSMWRAYASDGEGCAIIFDTTRLIDKDAIGQFPITAWNVKYYDEKSANRESAKIANRIISVLEDLKAEEFESNMDGIKSYINSRVSDLCFASKHLGFSEEKEVRLVYRSEYDLKPKTFSPCAKIMGNQVNARLPVELKEYPEFNINISLKNIVHSVMIGPSENQIQITKSLQLALCDAGIDCTSSNLLKSSTPYRPNRR